MSTTKERPPLAIVGVSALFPGSTDERGFWRDILAGRDLIREVPATHWLREDYFDADPSAPDKTYATRGAFLETVDFDALGFGVPPSIVPATDTSQLLALIVAQRVLDEACRGQFAGTDRDRVSVILGVTSGQELLSSMVSRLQRPIWVKALREAGLPESKVREACDRITAHYTPWQESTFPGLLGNVVAGRIANRFDTGGTNCVTDAACASSFSAIAMAANELQLHQSDLVITGGVDALNDIFMYMCFAKTQALSRTGDCRPFSDEADGTLLGEGLAMFALKRLEDAEAAGDRVYAVLRGVGSSSDGRAKSVYAPRPEGQAKAIARAYEQAGYGPESVELVEAHGTGTKAGDAAEFQGLGLSFDTAKRADRQWCALGSVKSQIGHTKAAAGAAGLFKAVMSLVHRTLPPTIKIARPNPRLELEKSAFYLNTQARPWVRASSEPRRAGVSSFGFGGSNFHLAVEEYRGPAPHALRKRVAACELVTLGAASAKEMLGAIRALDTTRPLAAVARRSQESCAQDAPVRLGIIAADEKELKARLEAAAQAIAKEPAKGFSLPGTHYGCEAREGGLALLFPGQGSQYVGMGADLAMTWREALEPWDRAAAIVEGLPGVVFPRPAFSDEERAAQAARLKQTEWAQPALGATSLSQLALLSRLGVKADFTGGHSFGEVVALFAAGAFDEATMLRIARRRGELMAEAARTPGAMTAALAPSQQVQAAIAGIDGVVIANFNAPKQAVLSGSVDAIARAESALASQAIRFQRLDVATAFHSPLVSESARPFEEFLATVAIEPPQLPVFSNTEAAPYPSDAPAIRRLLAAQLAHPVHFVAQIEAMYASGARAFLEVGAGSTLTGLVERILEGRSFRAISLDARGKNGTSALFEGLARLWAAGYAMNLPALWEEFQPVEERPAKKNAVTIPLCGANYGKPYPPPQGASALPPPNPETAPAPALAASSGAPQWLDAYQQAQRETLEAHAAWQRSMTETHTAFLKAMERSFALVGSSPSVTLPETPSVLPQLPRTAQAPAIAPVPAAAPQSAPRDLKAILLEVVSKKTGYPADMLSTELSLEADLGIDSIKRVEILSGVRERVPELPEVDPASMASLRTLGAILDALKLNGAGPIAKGNGAAAPAPARDLKSILLEIVSLKTGYPADMLSTELSLEADLGIDSIKRVEILSAVRERVPELPEVNPASMAALRTLGAILDALKLNGTAKDQSVATQVAETIAAPIATAAQRFVLETVARPAPGLGISGLSNGRKIVVTNDGHGIADALVEALRRRELDAERVSEIPSDAEAVIFLGGLGEAGDGVVREAFRAARSVAARFTASGGLFVTVQDTGGDFGLSGSERASVAGIAGIAKTAALEWPKASVKAIDFERGSRTPSEIAEAIVAELLEGGLEREVGLCADGRRLALRLVPRAISDEAGAALDEQSVIVATGGARGVTARCLIELARRTHARFVLLGRTELGEEPAFCRGIEGDAELKRVFLDDARARHEKPTPQELARSVRSVLAAREIRATLKEISTCGQARYLAVDARDADSVKSALEGVRREWGPIAGLVHGAGVIADKRIAEKTDAAFDSVYDTKVASLGVLLGATVDDPLRLLCLFSSVAARFGNAGQCDYAAANEALNKIASLEARRRGKACVVKSIGWGPWDGGMVDASLRARFASTGTALISLEAGAQAFADEVLKGGGATEVIVGGPLGSLASADELSFEVMVDRTTHPQLSDHRIENVPVLPVVQALEWFTRAAKAIAPELEVVACRDVRVLRGVRLDRFEDGGNWLTVACKRVNGGPMQLELRSADGTLHYAASLELAQRSPERIAPPPAPASLEQYGDTIYGGDLFHGPQFQVVREVEGVSAEGMVGTLDGTVARGWRGPWLTDAAALDGGLQLALLWSGRVIGGHSLPTSIGAVRTYEPGAHAGPIRCILHGRVVGDSKTESDIAFISSDGAVLCELCGVEAHRRPDRK